MNTSSLNTNNAEEQFELGIAILNKAWKTKELQMLDEIEGLKKIGQKKQEEIHQINQQHSKLQFEYQSLNTAMKTIQEMNQDLQSERDRLSAQVKALNGELSKLKAFKKQIIQSINLEELEDPSSNGNNTSQFIPPTQTNNSMMSENRSFNSSNINNQSIMQQQTQSQQAQALEGKEFFKQAKEVLTNRQFADFLQQIKLLNNQQQSAQQTLDNVNIIFKGEHPNLIEGFKRILTQRQQSAAMNNSETSFIDSDELDKVEVVGNEIFIQRRELIRDIFKNWIIDIAFICLGIMSLWRIPRIILHYLTIITNEEKAGSMRNKAMEEFVQSILDVVAITAMVVLVVPTLYRVGTTIKRIRTEDTLYQFIIISEAFAVLKDLPFILLGLLSMWRLPVIILKIWVFHKEEYETAEKRRKLALQQFLDAMIDIPFTISLVLMILSIMHIFTIFLLFRKYKKAKKEEKELGKQRELFTFFRGKVLKQLYLLPLQIPLIICTYLVTFTVYRIPITVTTMKSLVGQKEPKKLAAKVIVSQALSIPLDLICTVFSAIIVLTVYRIKDLVAVLKTHPVFKSTFAIREALEVHKQIALVFWNLVKDIPIIILFLLSSLTVWRIKHILRALANETDYKKRLILLGTNAFLTVLDIPCILCSALLLVSWRSKRVVNIITAAYVSGKLSEAHYSILLEFYELILDIIHIALIPLLLWRIPNALKSAWIEETAKGRRGIIRYHLSQIILDVPYMLLTLVVVLSVYRNVELYHFLSKKKSKRGYREFIRDQALQLIIDIPLVIISLCTCIVIPYRVYFMFKYLFLYEQWKNRDEERRRELRVLIAKTLVDLLTLVFGIALLVMFWRIPFVVYRYLMLKEGVRRTLWIEFKSAILDIICLAALFINLTFVYQFPYTVKRLYFFTVACIKHLMAFMKTKPFSTTKSKTKNTSEDNGEILPSDMFFEILTYLTPEENAASFDRVCKHWHELSRQDSFLWQLYLDIDKKANLIDKKFQAKYNNTNNYNSYHYYNNINLNEAYYSAIGSYKNEDFTSVFKKAFSASDSENRNEYIKRYLEKKSRYSYKQYTFEDAVNDDYKAGFHHIVKAETQHVIEHIYKLFFIRYKLLGLVLYPFYYLISLFSHVEGIESDMTWDRIEFLVLLIPINLFMLLVSLTEKLFNLMDVFPFLGYRWWGDRDFQLWNYRSFYGKKYATSVFLGIASVLSSVGIILYGFSVAFSPFYFDIRVLVCKTVMSIGSIASVDSIILNICKKKNIDLEELRKQALVDHMNRDFASDAVNYWHFEDNISVRKLEMDRFDRLIAFRPLLARMTPNFYKNVISNNNFISSLNEKECSIVQRILDQILYQKHSTLSNMDTDESLCILFLLGQAHGDLIYMKSMIIQSVITKIGFDNVLDILESIESYLTRDASFFSSTSAASPLMKIKDYCLDFMGSQASEPGYEFFIETDERVDKYLRLIIKRKTIKPVTWEEKPNNISKSPLMDLFNDHSTSDICFLVGNQKIHCHKTVLISRSVYFETLFEGNWSIELEEYGPEMKYLIQYCYGFMNYVPSIHQIPLIKKAHQHEMKDLIPIVSKQIIVGKDNFEMLWSELEHYSDDSTFSEIIERVIKYGFDHGLFGREEQSFNQWYEDLSSGNSDVESFCFDQQEDMIINTIQLKEVSSNAATGAAASSVIESIKGHEVIDITEDDDSQNDQEVTNLENVMEINSSDEDEEIMHNDKADSEDDSDDEIYFLTSDEEEDYHPSKTTKRMDKILSELVPDVLEGNFSVGGEFDIYPAIGLQLLVSNDTNVVVERRNISLPFASKEQANDIIQLTTMNEETKPWQLELNQFEITNPNWNDMINNLLQKEIKQGLGVGAGGEMSVKYKSNENFYPNSSKSHYSTSYVAFYHESDFKVNVLTSGLRLALVYNVIFNGPYYLMPAANAAEMTLNYLSKTLNEWESETPYIIYILNEQYSRHELSDGSNLKENDAVIYDWLRNYNSIHNNFYLCLGNMHKSKSGDVTSMSVQEWKRHKRLQNEGGRNYENSDLDDVDSEDLENSYSTYTIEYLKNGNEIFSKEIKVSDISIIIPFDRINDFENDGFHVYHDDRFLVKANFSNCKHKYFDMLVDDQLENPNKANVDKILEMMKTNWLQESALLNAVLKLKNDEIATEFSNKHLCLKSWQDLISTFGFMNSFKQPFFKFITSNLSSKMIFDFAFETILLQENSTLTSDLCDYVFEYLSTTGYLSPYAVERILNCMQLCAVPLMESTSVYMIKRCMVVDQTELSLILKYLENYHSYMVSALNLLLGNKEKFLRYYTVIIYYLKYFFCEEVKNFLEGIITEMDLNTSLKFVIHLNGLGDHEVANVMLLKLRERIINQFITDDISVENCKAIISAICYCNFPNELSEVTSAITSKIKDFVGVAKILIPLIKYIEITYGKSAFIDVKAFAQLVTCSIELIKSILNIQEKADVRDWSLPTFVCETNCSNCRDINNFLQNSNPASKKYELHRTMPLLRSHIETNLHSVTGLFSYITFETNQRTASVIIQKISNPRLNIYEQCSKTKDALNYLENLLSNTPIIQQQPTQASSSLITHQPKRSGSFSSSYPNKKKK
ncbi:hypothetical protein NAEGRDRAFT_59810 [Naegleria gruberi]|uniref:BTB domain-containing protein n=1 Tax=Naegleria gruberi TaxID=5762 RepID=D2W111_NAEGR|nr:uncharacterized protein NAEGRDRAFT_59810 [Naegleria gruberi]EFC37278.1 hypothetical protein NAEGRDRAFT_59810 [Naegleria gruberi]|eukprot:XP_002670022.1 hypothetical protein NAEGRDRAFT_59810 [Naegleria gruberi strain NEG-M]